MADEILTQELANKYFEYKNGELYWKIKISKNKQIGDIAGCVQKNGYKIFMFKNKFYYAHRVIYLIHYGFIPKYIDHIDRNPSNNKIENLRQATQSDNICNRPVQCNSKSGVKGVFWIEKRQRWVAKCQYQGKSKSKYFKNIEQAEDFVRKLRQEMHQNFTHH